jgi:hypothetical protein
MAAKKGLMEQARFTRACATARGAAAHAPPSSAQDLATLDVTKLTPLSPEVISRQATINIGARDARPAVACALFCDARAQRVQR